MKKTKEKGITLIALIITVIVMLILAGVAINLTIGDNGIFRKSDEGAQIYKNATNNEAIELGNVEQEMEGLMNQYNGGTSTDNPSPTMPIEKPIYTENSTINKGEPNAFNPEIPKGFRPVDVEDALWGDGTNQPTQEAVKKGLVIEDEEHNQFVWIAVDGTDVVLGRYVFKSAGVINTDLSKTEPTEQLKANYSTSNYHIEGLKTQTTPNTHAIDIEGFRTSVAEHGGYYIARYEASFGTDGKPNSKVSTSFTIERGEANAPTVEGQLWNNITQPNAANACRNMYDSSYGVTSDLVNSYAWDTAILFIQKNSDNSDYSNQKGENISSSLNNTGVNGDEKCHIHDMAGNCEEWSTETYISDNLPCTSRGGRYGWRNTAQNRSGTVTTNVSIVTTFRPILYL